jgi:hypothetical protein
MTTTAKCLAVLAIVEAGMIAALLIDPRHVVVKVKESPATIVESPIALAAKYESSDKKFEEVVRANLKLLPYRPLGDKSFSILAECAYHRQTNYVRILVENGANAGDALKEFGGFTDESSQQAKELIQQIAAESKIKP